MKVFSSHNVTVKVLLFIPACVLSLLTLFVILLVTLVCLPLPLCLDAQMTYVKHWQGRAKFCLGWRFFSINIQCYPHVEISIGQRSINYFTFSFAKKKIPKQKFSLHLHFGEGKQLNIKNIDWRELLQYIWHQTKYRKTLLHCKLGLADPILFGSVSAALAAAGYFAKSYRIYSDFNLIYQHRVELQADIQLLLSCRPLPLYFGLRKRLRIKKGDHHEHQ